MKLPTKAYEAEFGGNYTYVNYYPRENSSSPEDVKLPKWLVELIRGEVAISRQEGRIAVQREIRAQLGIDECDF